MSGARKYRRVCAQWDFKRLSEIFGGVERLSFVGVYVQMQQYYRAKLKLLNTSFPKIAIAHFSVTLTKVVVGPS